MKIAADNPPKDEAEWRHQAVAYVHGLLALNDLVFTCAVSGDSIGDSRSCSTRTLTLERPSLNTLQLHVTSTSGVPQV